MEEYELCVGVGLHFGRDRDTNREGREIMKRLFSFLFFSFLFSFLFFFSCSFIWLGLGSLRERTERVTERNHGGGIEREPRKDLTKNEG